MLYLMKSNDSTGCIQNIHINWIQGGNADAFLFSYPIKITCMSYYHDYRLINYTFHYICCQQLSKTRYLFTVYNSVQRQTTVTAYFSSKQLLLFVFVWKYYVWISCFDQ